MSPPREIRDILLRLEKAGTEVHGREVDQMSFALGTSCVWKNVLVTDSRDLPAADTDPPSTVIKKSFEKAQSRESKTRIQKRLKKLQSKPF